MNDSRCLPSRDGLLRLAEGICTFPVTFPPPLGSNGVMARIIPQIMKLKLIVVSSGLLVLANVCLTAAPLGSAFTYQGRLADNGAAANGRYDFRFAVFDAANGGNVVSLVLTNPGVAVSNGLFTVTLDFLNYYLAESANWLEISARTNGAIPFTTLIPRQPLTAAPA